MKHSRWLAVSACACALWAAGCSSGTENNDADAEDFRQQLTDGFSNNLAGFSNAIQRLVLAINGQAQTGVTLTPIAGGFQGSVGVDVNGDGSLETTVAGQILWVNPSQGLYGGANFVLNGITGGAPQTASGSSVITQTGATSVAITNGYFTTETQTRGNSVEVTDANLDVDVGGGAYNVDGTADFRFNGLRGSLTFEPVGTWFKITVTGNFPTFVIQ